jgi:hypothetical protein
MCILGVRTATCANQYCWTTVRDCSHNSIKQTAEQLNCGLDSLDTLQLVAQSTVVFWNRFTRESSKDDGLVAGPAGLASQVPSLITVSKQHDSAHGPTAS